MDCIDNEKKVRISILLDFYGDLLTEKQYLAVSLHYNEDYSLFEISEQTGTTRQGVFESIKKGIDNLEYFELKLMLYEKSLLRDSLLDDILKLTGDEAVKKILDEIRAVN